MAFLSFPAHTFPRKPLFEVFTPSHVRRGVEARTEASPFICCENLSILLKLQGQVSQFSAHACATPLPGMPSRVSISTPRHSLAVCYERYSACNTSPIALLLARQGLSSLRSPSSSHAKDYRLFAHRPQSHVSPARISLRRMRSQVAQAQSSKTPLTMRCPGPDKVKEQEAMTGARRHVWNRETRRGTSTGIFAFSSKLMRPAVFAAASCWLGCPYQPRRHFGFGTWVVTWLGPAKKARKISLGRSPTSWNAKDYFTGYARFHGNSIIFWIKSGWIQSEGVLRFYPLA